MSAGASPPDALAGSLVARLPAGVTKPGYDRAALAPAWRISASAPSTAATRPNTPTTCSRRASTAGAWSASTSARRGSPRRSGRQDGLYTRAAAATDDRVEARVIGSLVSIVDSQDRRRRRRSHVLASPEIEVVTHDGHREGLLPPARRRRARPRPSRHRPRPRQSAKRRAACPACSRARWSCACTRTAGRSRCVSCDNIPANGAHPRQCRAALAERRGDGLARLDRAPMPPFPRPWSTASCRRPRRPTSRRSSSASAIATRAVVGRRAVPPMGDREPLRRPLPAMGPGRRDLRRRRHAVRASQDARAQRRAVDARLSRRARRPRAHLRRRWPTRCSRPSSAACWSRRALPTLQPVPGIDAARLCRAEPRSGCATRRSATATTRSPPTARRRSCSACSTRSASGCARGESVDAASTLAVAAWMAYLIRASRALRRQLDGRRPLCRRAIAAIADAIGDDAAALVDGILAHRRDLRPARSPPTPTSARRSAGASAGCCRADPVGFVRRLDGGTAD